MNRHDTDLGGVNRGFRTTIWGDILAARDPSNPKSRDHLSRLLNAYWKPVYVYVRHVWKAPAEDAKDLTQAFFTRFLEKDAWSLVDPGRGSFRSYLKQALRHFLINAREHATAQRRHAPIVSLDATDDLDARLPATGENPEKLYDREWLRCLMSEATAELRAKLEADGKAAYFRVFEAYCIAAGGEPTYADVARRLGLQESDVRNYLAAARKMLQEILRGRVRDIVESDDDVERELREIGGT